MASPGPDSRPKVQNYENPPARTWLTKDEQELRFKVAALQNLIVKHQRKLAALQSECTCGVTQTFKSDGPRAYTTVLCLICERRKKSNVASSETARAR